MAVIAAKVDPIPDMGAVGNAARASKGGAPKDLVNFSVSKGDNGGVIITCNYRTKVPEGRRAGAGFPLTSDSKEHMFGPDQGDKVAAFIGDKVSEMTGGKMSMPSAEGPMESEETGPPASALPPAMPPAPRPAPIRTPPPRVAAVTPNRVTAAGPGGIASARRPLY